MLSIRKEFNPSYERAIYYKDSKIATFDDIRLFALILTLFGIFIYALEIGRTATLDYVKVAAYMCNQGCSPIQEGNAVIWNCNKTNDTNMSFNLTSLNIFSR